MRVLLAKHVSTLSIAWCVCVRVCVLVLETTFRFLSHSLPCPALSPPLTLPIPHSLLALTATACPPPHCPPLSSQPRVFDKIKMLDQTMHFISFLLAMVKAGDYDPDR